MDLRTGEQSLLLSLADADRIVLLGRLHLPREYAGEWRCDMHPRCSPDGRSAIIDSPHGGNGRQMHLVDTSGVV